MANAPLELLLESLAEVLETTAFVSLTPSGPEPPRFDRAFIISIPLGLGCKIHLAAPREFGAVVAAGMLALELGGAEADERAQDALQEIINVTAGLYLSRAPWLEGRIPEMDIPTARYVEDAGQVTQWIQTVSARVVQAESYPIAVAIEGRL